jgi:hypothetical protein
MIMAGVARCGVKVTPDGKPDENGKPCSLKEGHDLKTAPHKPRTAVKIDDDALKMMSASVTVVTDTEQISEARRTRAVEDSPLTKMAAAVVKGGHDAWERAGKHPLSKWEKTPTIAMDALADLETKLRTEIHRAAAAAGWKVNFGETKPLFDVKPVVKDGKPVIKDGKPVTESVPNGLVKMFFQVRDLPSKPDAEAKPETEAKPDAKPETATSPVAPSAKERLAKA